MNQLYLDTARLLTQVAPPVFADGSFALKGGTAINLFARDMPRLSVDLDLVYPDHMVPREKALKDIAASLRAAAEQLKRRDFEVHIPKPDASAESKLLVRRDGIEVKVEVNTVLRGTVQPVGIAGLRPNARATLMTELEIPVVSLADMYGGKLVAALDRQHPRDLFDVMQLFAGEGITPKIRRAFVVYLASHNRPVHEVLFPALRDITTDYNNNFAGMTTEPVALDDLLAARERMVQELQAGLDETERNFLISLVAAKPDWPLLGIAHLAELPGLRWKLLNLEKLQKENPKQFAQQYALLAERLAG